MGTRHLICVALNGEYRIAQYGQWDGYPSGAGFDILDFLRKDYKPKKFEQAVRNLRTLSYDEVNDIWMANGADGSGLVPVKIARKVADAHPALSRDTGADILSLVQSGKVTAVNLRQSFAKDSLFCEWAYVIDLDAQLLEVYHGGNLTPLTEKDRFYEEGYVAEPDYENGPVYQPVKLAKAYSLNDLPTNETFSKEVERIANRRYNLQKQKEENEKATTAT